MVKLNPGLRYLATMLVYGEHDAGNDNLVADFEGADFRFGEGEFERNHKAICFFAP